MAVFFLGKILEHLLGRVVLVVFSVVAVHPVDAIAGDGLASAQATPLDVAVALVELAWEYAAVRAIGEGGQRFSG